MTTTQTHDLRSLTARLFSAMEDGGVEDFRLLVHPDGVDREATISPPDCRGPGPEPFHRAALWLRGMFSDLHWEFHEVVVEGDLVAAYLTMSGRHTGPQRGYDPAGALVIDRPATGRSFAVTQTHWLRYLDGLVVEHWANRDDRGMALQLGFLGPPPAGPQR
ncbi:ester cyclase [Pseudonocardia saturnea]